MDFGTFHAWWTVGILVAFVAIVAWVWSGKRKHKYERAARIPFDEDDRPASGEPARRRQPGEEGRREDGEHG